ncbi:hypothetical protein BU25DRAFT_476648 [Macroventuria anomochaeta]|uniref:Uncharacterized protein n=1 Tax=Macroventuria anomochaeta TaxID=301207 RepID=A0ACB6RR85_9PLEO|nr:uncharacterized protein BU25DRAFT_476648 [Macroventuria anomochaeta]KAF2624406.1 hypothetical protein BU25DRAFT_476648 [Macroventuria anomochaeta]
MAASKHNPPPRYASNTPEALQGLPTYSPFGSGWPRMSGYQRHSDEVEQETAPLLGAGCASSGDPGEQVTGEPFSSSRSPSRRASIQKFDSLLHATSTSCSLTSWNTVYPPTSSTLSSLSMDDPLTSSSTTLVVPAPTPEEPSLLSRLFDFIRSLFRSVVDSFSSPRPPPSPLLPVASPPAAPPAPPAPPVPPSFEVDSGDLVQSSFDEDEEVIGMLPRGSP